MRPLVLYRILAGFALAAAGTAFALAMLALGLDRASSAGAAALCGGVFLAPGIVLWVQCRRLQAREAALLHVASLVRDRDLKDADGIAGALGVLPGDALRILRAAVREGYVDGHVDDSGRITRRGESPER